MFHSTSEYSYLEENDDEPFIQWKSYDITIERKNVRLLTFMTLTLIFLVTILIATSIVIRRHLSNRSWNNCWYLNLMNPNCCIRARWTLKLQNPKILKTQKDNLKPNFKNPISTFKIPIFVTQKINLNPNFENPFSTFKIQTVFFFYKMLFWKRKNKPFFYLKSVGLCIFTLANTGFHFEFYWHWTGHTLICVWNWFCLPI